MGAEPYAYFVDYTEDVQSALEKLRKEVFENRQFFGADMNPGSPEEALEMTEEEGTRSILDIMRITDQPEFCSAAPLSDDELLEFFGTAKPTDDMVEKNDDFWESLERGMARYVITYEGDIPSKIFFAGYSFD